MMKIAFSLLAFVTAVSVMFAPRTSLATQGGIQADGAASAAPVSYRPAFHFSPAKNWMNDPNGLVWMNGEYHLFFQYNPFGIMPAHMSWGHAVSKDLVHWKELPVAIPEQNGGAIFSGSAVTDPKNTSGFGKADRPAMVAVYTIARPGLQNQNISFSNDLGRTFTAYQRNPVIDLKLPEFRDPMVFWHAPTRRWVMVVSMADQRKVRFYHSNDLKSWELGGEFGPAGPEGVPNWECPNLFPLSAGGQTKWVLMLGIGAGGKTGGPAGGSATLYFVGDFDGNSFKNDNPAEKTLWLDYGSDFYATQVWSSTPPGNNRRLAIGWMSNWSYGTKLPTQPWRGQMSVPRELSLVKSKDGWRVHQAPARELEALRSGPPLVHANSFAAAEMLLAGKQMDNTFEISLHYKPAKQSEAGVVLTSGSEATKIGFDGRTSSLFVDRSKAGSAASAIPGFAARHSAAMTGDGDVTLHIIVDRCSVEVFGNDGQTTITDLIFPATPQTTLGLYSSESNSLADFSMDVWRMHAQQ
jgi:fructan beta-fructosidase